MSFRITDKVAWVGKIDWELRRFHGDEYSTHRGSSYNSYLIKDKKNVLIDTVWTPFAKEFVENLRKEIDLEKIKEMADEDVIKTLVKLKGIGKWTAEMLMIFSLKRPDIISYDDLAIRRGMMKLYKHRDITPELFEKYRRRYSPYSSVASLYLWEKSKE